MMTQAERELSEDVMKLVGESSLSIMQAAGVITATATIILITDVMVTEEENQEEEDEENE